VLSAAAAEPLNPNSVANHLASNAPRNNGLSSSSAQALPQVLASSVNDRPTNGEVHNTLRPIIVSATTASNNDDETIMMSPPQPLLADLRYARLKGLPVHNTVLWETMRLHLATILSLRRQMPYGWAPMASTGCVDSHVQAAARRYCLRAA
jgi:hypothetical protein